VSKRQLLISILVFALGALAPHDAFAAAAPAAASNAMTVDLSGGGVLTERIVQLLGLITILSLAPSILIMMTCFVRIVVVLSLLRTAMGIQQSPPNSVIVSLALFLTLFVMTPTFTAVYDNAIGPLTRQEITTDEAFTRASGPMKTFMGAHTREQDLALFLDMGKMAKPKTPEETPLQALIPAFMISELKRAFEIGFLIFVPFLVIDMAVSSILMSMGMMMLPPVVISLPFKLIFFVLVDGWRLIAGSLVASYTTGTPPT
jgi:flagellar biosynthetic protein FliP